MKKGSVFAVVFVAVFALGTTVFGENQARELALEVKKDSFKLTNGDMVVNNRGSQIQIHGPYGNFTTNRIMTSSAKIKVLENTDTVKSILLTAKKNIRKQELIFKLRVTAKADSSVIKLVFATKNPLKEAVRRHFFIRFPNLSAVYYYDENGKQSMGKSEIYADWIFIPRANTAGGYGIIPINEDTKMITLYPDKAWEEIGLYFAPVSAGVKRMLQPDEEATMGFMIMPVTSEIEVADEYEKLNSGQ